MKPSASQATLEKLEHKSNGAGLHRGFAFNNDSSGIQGTFDKFIRYTTDGGFTWTNTPLQHENWQPAGIKGTNIYFAGSESFIGTDLLYRSLDGGMSWSMIFPFAGKSGLTGTIRADEKHVYAQSDAGIYVSRDSGITWKFVFGPPNGWDTRFYADGDTVFAGDYYGNLWMSPTAGLSPFTKRIEISNTVLHFFASSCSVADTGFLLRDPNNCSNFRVHLDSAYISGSKNFAFINSGFPIALDFGKRYNVEYKPGSSYYDTGYLHLRFFKDSAFIDTTLLLLGERAESYGVFLTPSAIRKQFPTPCQVLDTFVVIKNFPCDTVTIASASFMNPNVFSITSPPLPVVLPPDSSVAIHIQGMTSAKGFFFDTIGIALQYKTKLLSKRIPLTFGVSENVNPILKLLPGGLGFGNISVCKPTVKHSYFKNPVCRDYALQSITQTSGAPYFSITGMPTLPRLFQTGDIDSIEITFAPQKSGNFLGSIAISYLYDGHLFDTTIKLGGVGMVGTSANFTDSLVEFGPAHICEMHNRETWIQNTDCTSADLLKLLFNSGKNFSVLQPKLPVTIAPGDSVKVILQCSPGAQPILSDVLTAILQSKGGGMIGISVPLSANIFADTGRVNLSAASIIFDTISVCAFSDTIISINNPLPCDSLFIDSVTLAGDADFSSTTLANILAPSDSAIVRIHFAPQSEGLRHAMLHLTYHYGTQAFDTLIEVTAISRGVARTLSLALDSLDFGAHTICENPDTIITIRNTGCESVLISDGKIFGTGFTLTGVTFPFTIAPNKELLLHILSSADTTDAKTVNAGYLILSANTDRTMPAITLARQIISPYKIFLKPVSSSYSGSTFSCKILSDSFDLSAIHSINFDLGCNSELLEFKSAAGPNTISNSGNHFQMAGNPGIIVLKDSSIGELFFRVFLSPDSVTTLHFSNPHLNITDPSFEKCLATADADTLGFRYIFVCGERQIFDFMNGNFHLTRLQPNPALNEIIVEIFSSVKSEFEIEIRNMLGASVFSEKKNAEEGMHTISLDTHSLAGGMYEVCVTSNGHRESLPFIKIK